MNDDTLSQHKENRPRGRPRGRLPKNDTTSKRALQIKQDKLEAWRLRSEEGLTYREIAKRLGINLETAYRYISEKIDIIEGQILQYKEMRRQTQLEDIERVLAIMFQQLGALPVINPQDPHYSVYEKVQIARARSDIVRTITALLERQANLLGLDAPTQIEDVTNQAVPFIIMNFDPTKPPPPDNE